METFRDLAIVLRSIPYEERNRIVTALTEQHGLVSAVAKNSMGSRRFGGSLEVFAASEWQFTKRGSNESELCFLGEALIREPFLGLRTDFEKLSLASVFNELMLRVAPPFQRSSDLFKLHSNALSVIAGWEGERKLPVFLFLNAYLAKILQWSGNQPRLQKCLNCETRLESLDSDEILSCRVDDAGWVCGECRNRDVRHIRRTQSHSSSSLQYTLLRVPAEAMADLHFCLQMTLRQIVTALEYKPISHQSLFQFLEALLIFHVPGFDKTPLKSLRFLQGNP